MVEETREPGARASGGLSATAQPTSLESSPSPEAPQISGSMGLDGEERACPSYPPEATLAGIHDIPRAMMVEDFDAQGSRTTLGGLVGPGVAHGQLACGTAKAAGDAHANPPIPSGSIDGFTSSPIARIGTLDLPSLLEAGGTSQRCALAPAATTALAGAGGDSIGSERVKELPCAQTLLDGPNLMTATRSTVDKEVQSGSSAAAEPRNGLKGGPNARDLHEESPSPRSGRLRTPSRAGASRDAAVDSVTSTPVIPRLPRQELGQDASSVVQSFESSISASQPSVGSMAGPAIPFEHGLGPTVEAVENSEGRASPGSALNGLEMPRSTVCVPALGSGNLGPGGRGIDRQGHHDDHCTAGKGCRAAATVVPTPSALVSQGGRGTRVDTAEGDAPGAASGPEAPPTAGVGFATLASGSEERPCNRSAGLDAREAGDACAAEPAAACSQSCTGRADVRDVASRSEADGWRAGVGPDENGTPFGADEFASKVWLVSQGSSGEWWILCYQRRREHKRRKTQRRLLV